MIKSVHDCIDTHFGYLKCVDIIKRSFIWRGMDAMVRKYISNCVTCQTSKSSLPLERTQPAKVLSSTDLMSKLAVDFLGHFSMTRDKHLYIAVAVCYATRHITAWPTRTTSAREFAQGFIKNVVSVYGAPLQVISDRGPNFVADIWRETADLLKISLDYSSPFLPTSNSRVERMNKVIVNILKCTCERNPTTWDRILPLVVFNLNNTICRATGFSSHEVLFGRNLRSITDMAPPPDRTLAEHNENLLHAQREALQIIRDHNAKMMRDESPTRRTSTIEIGDICFWRRPALDDPRLNKKLQKSQRGPFRVIRRSPYQVILQEVQSGKILKNPVSIKQIVRPRLFDKQ